MKKSKEGESEIGAIASGIEDVNLAELLDVTDGYAGSYYCETAFFVL